MANYRTFRSIANSSSDHYHPHLDTDCRVASQAHVHVLFFCLICNAGQTVHVATNPSAARNVVILLFLIQDQTISALSHDVCTVHFSVYCFMNLFRWILSTLLVINILFHQHFGVLVAFLRTSVLILRKTVLVLRKASRRLKR